MNKHPLLIPRKAALLAIIALFMMPSLVGAQSYPPVWNNTSTYVAGDMVTDYGNVYRCIKAVSSPFLDPSETYSNWELTYVRSGTTLVIGPSQVFPTFALAWTYAQNATIAQGAYLHFSIVTTKGDLTEQCGAGLNLDHPFGASISITGDDPKNINLQATNGVTLDSGHTIALISGVTFEATGGSQAVGITVTGNAAIESLTDVDIEAPICILADLGGRLNCASTVSLHGFNKAVTANRGGSVIMGQGTALDGLAGSKNSVLVYAANGAYIEINHCTLMNAGYGIQAEEGGLVSAEYASFQTNNISVYAEMNGHVVARDCQFGTGLGADTLYDIESLNGSTVDHTGSNDTKSRVGVGDGSYILG